MLEFAILGLLHQSPMHGYELRKQLAEVLGGLRSISYGSLYPALKRMHAAGLDQHRRARPARAAAGRRPAAHRPPRQGRLHDHRRGQGALPRAGRPDRPGGLRRRRPVRRPAGVLPAHGGRRPAADPRGPPAHGRAAARGPALLAGPHPRTARPLHPRAAAARPGIGRPRGPLALRADRHRAPRRRRSTTRRTDPSTRPPEPDAPASRPASPARRHSTQDRPRSAEQRPFAVRTEGESMGTVKVAIVGVGNCAASLVQGVRVLPGRRRSRRPCRG